MCDPVAQGAHHGYNAATQQRSNAAFFYCVGLWMVLSIAGCNQSHSIEALAIASDMASHSNASPTFDAGIVLSDRSGYTCIPLDRIGLPPDAQIVQAHLADGTKREFSVDLLHTTLLENTVSATTLNEVSP